MGKQRRGPGGNRKSGGRTTPKGTRPASVAPPVRPAPGLPPLVGDAERCLREGSPFELLAFASGLVEATTPRQTDLWGPARKERPDGAATFLSMADSGWPALGGLVLAVAVLLPDELLARRLRAAVDPLAIRPSPKWLATMADIEVTAAMTTTELLNDGENVIVSWRWPGGQEGSAIVYVDHNMGTIVKDAFAIPAGHEEYRATVEMVGETGLVLSDIDPADARARLEEAIESGERVVPPIESDDWPASRPLVEWVIAHLPEGGAGYVRPEWSNAQREQLLDDFVASPFGEIEGLPAELVRELADPLVWFACDYGPGDPLRWSPVSVEIVLADWYARKVMGVPPDEMSRVPDVLAGFVGFAAGRKGIPDDVAAETVEAIQMWRGDFMIAIGKPGRTREGNAARLARIAAGLDPDDVEDGVDFDGGNDGFGFGGVDLDGDGFDMGAVVEELESNVVAFVGGREAYDALDDEPLGDVSFDWSRVPDALRAPVEQTLGLLDAWAVELFDAEVRTIARAVLAGVVVADPSVYKRSLRADALAAGVLSFVMGRLARRPEERRALGWGVTTQKELGEATGVAPSNISARTRTIANVVGRADIDWPQVLHSSQRREALETKHLIADWPR